MSSYASKTNLAALKTEVDKIDTDKLKTVPNDLAKLSNVVKNDVVKKTDYNALKSKVDGIDVSKYVGRTKYETDGKVIYDKIDKVDKKIPVLTDFVTTACFNQEKNLLVTKTALTAVENKIPDVSTLAIKTSLRSLLPVSTFNSKVTELEGKVTTVDNKLSGFVKKTDYGAEITKIKNDYATNASLDSKINDLKAQHISTEVKKIDDKTKKNASDILAFENRLKQKEDMVNENEREISFSRGFFFYIDQSDLVYDCKANSFNINSLKILTRKSTGVFNYNMKAVGNSGGEFSYLIDDGKLCVRSNGCYFTQSKALKLNNTVNIYIVYRLNPISSTRNTDYTIQNALFGAMKITKNTDYSKNNSTGYGPCFDKRGTFTHTIQEGNFDHTTAARNLIIFGVVMSFSVHATNRANNIYVIGEALVQGINDTTIYAEKNFYRNFTDPDKKSVLSLHYNGDNSYLFVNGRQELKFKEKNNQIIDEKFCLGNLSSEWTTSESEKTGLYGNIYDFVVDYKSINGVKPIYDIHRYLITKHNII